MKTIHSALRQPFALLSCLLLAAATTASAQEQTDSTTQLTYTIANGKATVTGGTVPNDGHLVIPGTLGGAPVTVIGVQAFAEKIRDPISQRIIQLPNVLKQLSASSVQKIESGAFADCQLLTEIHLPKVVVTKYWSFLNCDLRHVSLPKATKLSVQTFEGNALLESAFLPQATELHGACFYKTKLSRIYLGRAAKTFSGTPGDPFYGINDITIYHHPEDAEHYRQNVDFSRQNKQQVSRPFAGPVGVSAGSGSAAIQIPHASGSDDWTYAVERSTDLSTWADAAPTGSGSNTANDVVTKSRTFDASAPAAFYRVQASPTFMN